MSINPRNHLYPGDHPERLARKKKYFDKFGDRFPVTYSETKDPKKGDRYESALGRTFTITSVDRKTVSVDVQRTVARNGRPTIENRKRVVDKADWPSFARCYRKA